MNDNTPPDYTPLIIAMIAFALAMDVIANYIGAHS